MSPTGAPPAIQIEPGITRVTTPAGEATVWRMEGATLTVQRDDHPLSETWERGQVNVLDTARSLGLLLTEATAHGQARLSGQRLPLVPLVHLWASAARDLHSMGVRIEDETRLAMAVETVKEVDHLIVTVAGARYELDCDPEEEPTQRATLLCGIPGCDRPQWQATPARVCDRHMDEPLLGRSVEESRRLRLEAWAERLVVKEVRLMSERNALEESAAAPVANLRSALHQEITPERATEVFAQLRQVTGVRLLCVWDHLDQDGYGGDVQIYVDDYYLTQPSADLLAWLTGDPADPNTPRYPGMPHTWTLGSAHIELAVQDPHNAAVHDRR